MICDGTAPCMIRSKTSKTHNGWFGHCFRARNPADSVLAALIDFELSAWGVFVNNLSPFCIRVGVAEALTKCRDCLGQEGGDGCFEVHCLFFMIEWFWWKWNGKREVKDDTIPYFAYVDRSSKQEVVIVILSVWEWEQLLMYSSGVRKAGVSLCWASWRLVSDLLVFFSEVRKDSSSKYLMRWYHVLVKKRFFLSVEFCNRFCWIERECS